MRAATALIVVLIFCALTLHAQDPSKGVNFYSLEKEKALGEQLAKEFRTHTTVLDSPTVLARINEIAASLAPQSQYSFALITDDLNVLHEPNALPGGFIF